MLQRMHEFASRLVRALTQVGPAILLCFAASTLLDGLLRGLTDQPIAADPILLATLTFFPPLARGCPKFLETDRFDDATRPTKERS